MSVNDEVPFYADVIASKAGLTISKNHASLILDMLFKDGYVQTMSVSQNTYLILYKGILFSEEGGYTQKYKNHKIEITYKNWTTFALIFGGVAAGLYYTFYYFLPTFLRSFCGC